MNRARATTDAAESVRRGTERDGSRSAGTHRDRYLAAERIYLREADPVRLADLVIDNRVFARPRVLSP